MHKLSVSIAEPKKAPQSQADRERGDRGGSGWNNDANTSTPMSMANEKGIRTIYVRNLSPAVTEVMLIDLFRTYGEIEEVYLPPPREGKPRNFGFVHFYHWQSANNAVSDRTQRKLDGKVIDVDLAKNEGAAKFEASLMKNFGSAEATQKTATKVTKTVLNTATWKNPIYFWSIAGTFALFVPIILYSLSK